MSNTTSTIRPNGFLPFFLEMPDASMRLITNHKAWMALKEELADRCGSIQTASRFLGLARLWRRISVAEGMGGIESIMTQGEKPCYTTRSVPVGEATLHGHFELGHMGF